MQPNTETTDELQTAIDAALADVEHPSPWHETTRYSLRTDNENVVVTAKRRFNRRSSFLTAQTDALDDAGLDWHYKEDGRFRDGVRPDVIIVTGTTESDHAIGCPGCGFSYDGDEYDVCPTCNDQPDDGDGDDSDRDADGQPLVTDGGTDESCRKCSRRAVTVCSLSGDRLCADHADRGFRVLTDGGTDSLRLADDRDDDRYTTKVDQ